MITPPDHSATVHPHVRGEGLAGETRLYPADGSPPRAWGRRDDRGHARRAERFTPTCVGKAAGSAGRWPRSSVHPHVRGEGVYLSIDGGEPDGSPPRAWGRPAAATAGEATSRFTPTCVGKARTSALLVPLCPVHPHVRGEGAALRMYLKANGGSPPRAWGRRGATGSAAGEPRFTPTCVGKALTALGV